MKSIRMGNPTEWDEQSSARRRKLPEAIRPHLVTGDPCYSFVPEGWHDLVTNLHNNLITVVPDYKIEQVKEKFASLCFYTNIPHDPNSIANILIAHYEHLSSKTCQQCSAVGDRKSTKRGWLVTICKDCEVSLRNSEC